MGVVIVYDITNRGSFDNVNYWMSNLKEHAAENICKILLGNKIDCAEQKREVAIEEGRRLATKNAIKFFECSA